MLVDSQDMFFSMIPIVICYYFYRWMLDNTPRDGVIRDKYS